MKYWNELEQGKTYTNGIEVYKYMGIRACTRISTVYEFEQIEFIWDEDTDDIKIDEFGQPLYLTSTIYVDSQREKNFLKSLEEY